MNASALLSRVCSEWLTEPEQTSLNVNDTESLLGSVNSAVRLIWSELPLHLRIRPLSMQFDDPEAVDVPVARGAFSTTAVDDVEFDARYCSCLINGDPTVNELRKVTGVNRYTTFHPYLADQTGTKEMTIFRDAIVLPYQLERFTSPLVDIATGQVWAPLPAFTRRMFQQTLIRSYIVASTVDGTVLRVPGNDTLRVFEAEGIIRPSELTLGNCQDSTDLIYGDDIAQWIVEASGSYLLTHSKFNTERKEAAAAAQAMATERVRREVSPVLTCQPNPIGPPYGW